MKKYLYPFLIILTCGFSLPTQTEVVKTDEVKPVVILGGGIGALTSAIYLQRAGIPTTIIEGPTPGGAITQSPSVHNWPGEMQIDGDTLATKVRDQALANGATILPQEVTKVDFSKSILKITTRDVFDHDQVHSIEARSCIIALGSTPNLLGIPGESGEKGYWTRGVYSCAVCDGSLYKDKVVAVVGGGDAAIIEADYLSNIAKKVYVIIRSDKFRTVETIRKNELIKKSNVEVIYNTKVGEIQGDGQKVSHLKLSTSKDLSVDGVFIAIGATPKTEYFVDQIKLDQKGYVTVKDGQHTSVPGIFAIGDVADPDYKQAISAAGDGAKAALQVEQFLAASPKQELPKTPQLKIVEASNSSTADPVIELTSKDQFYQAIKAQSTPVVIDFYSPYCGPCRRLSPEFDKMAEKHKGKIRFLKVDATKFSEIASSYNIFGVPTLLVFNKKGNMVKRGTGMDEIQQIFKTLDTMTNNSQ